MSNNIRIGRVSSIQPEKCTARVIFDEQDEIVSQELPLLVRGSMSSKEYWMPAVNEQVLCIFTENKDGFIVGSFYSDVDKPAVASKDKRQLSFQDGTTIEYDAKTKQLSINAVGSVIINAASVVINGHVIG